VGDYDQNLPLIIDPELSFSTYSGSTADNFGFTATFDQEGFCIPEVLFSAMDILPLWSHTKPVGQAELVREILWEPISASPNTIRRELHWFTPPISAVRAMNYRTASSSTNKANCICMVHRVRPIIPQQAEHFRKYST